MNGCLVTDEVTFDIEEQNSPPILVDKPGSQTAIGEIIYFDLADRTPYQIDFELGVRDVDIGQVLAARYNLFSRDQSSLEFESDDIKDVSIGISGSAARDIEFSIGGGFFELDRCYRLELAVTSKFENRFSANSWASPADTDDIAKAIWYIVTGDSIGCQATTKYE
ncbi:MAG: hypothetical protein JXA30_17765 [Deltaproteobacteria bacterium]|nr:hypothetical protein [Deltaproteobacteria bacterium]